MLEHRFGKPFVVVYCAVADKLHLWDARDGLQIGVENRLLLGTGLVVAVSVALTLRIECLYLIKRK